MPRVQVIFVMEDIDAAGSVVQRRDAADGIERVSLVHEALRALQNSSPGAASPRPKEDSTVGHGAPDLVRLASYPPSTSSGCSMALSRRAPTRVAWVQAMGPFGLSGGKAKDGGDELNLAGILNVLDGVVDCPNRIVIMTSNHPEKLDPALIRPGRINKRLFLGYMTPQDAADMVAHHFPEATAAQVAHFRDTVTCDCLVPAKLEAMCAEHEDLLSLLAQLQACVHELEHEAEPASSVDAVTLAADDAAAVQSPVSTEDTDGQASDRGLGPVPVQSHKLFADDARERALHSAGDGHAFGSLTELRS